jgi:hypothetical protein
MNEMNYIKATLTAFGPDEGVTFTQDMWAKLHQAMTAIAAHPAPIQEPVAWMFEDDEDNGHKTFIQTPPSPEVVAYLAKWNRPAWVPLYTTPPAAQRQCEGCDKIAKP